VADIPTTSTPRSQPAKPPPGVGVATGKGTMPKTLVHENVVTTPPHDNMELKSRTVVAQGKPTIEYAVSRMREIAAGMIKALPPYIDDVTRDFGAAVRRMMLSTVDVLRMGATADGFPLDVPKGLEDSEKEYAQEIRDFCEWNLENVEPSFDDVLWELSACVYLGHKVAEKVYRLGQYRDDPTPKLILSQIKTKPQGSLSFVVDDKNNTLGFLPALHGQYTAPTFVQPADDGTIANLLPREKFVVATHDPENGDPRGRSRLRRAYTEWYMKQQLKPEYLQFLATQAVPSYWGTLPEDARGVDELDENDEPTGETIDPMTRLEEGLEAIRNGGTIAMSFGGAVGVLQVESEGDVFTNAFSHLDKQIAKGVTGQILATEEASYDTRGGSKTHQDTLGMPVMRITSLLANVIHDDILYWIVLYNYGEEAAQRYTPVVQSAAVEQQDLGATAHAYVEMQNAGLVEPEQRPAIWEATKLPPVDPKILQQREDEKKAAADEALKRLAGGQGDGGVGGQDGGQGGQGGKQPPKPPQPPQPGQPPAGGQSQEK
jgi:hypothetical protein